MSISATINGTVYTLPTSGDVDWGSQLSSFLAAVASNSGPTLISFGADSSNSNATSYLFPGYSDSQAKATEIRLPMPKAGVLRNLRVHVMGVTDTIVTFNVLKGGVATALVGALVQSTNDISDLTHSVAVAAGDLISVSASPFNFGHAALSRISLSMELDHQ